MAEAEGNQERLEFAGVAYLRTTSDQGGTLRGTLGLLDPQGERVLRQIPAFPHIKRIHRFRTGVRRFFGPRPFFVEEKLDGYNVRILRHEGRLLAATRGGFICPFTTEWAEIWSQRRGLGGFFDHNPLHVLCCEIYGDNPYNFQREPHLSPGAHLAIFDIISPQGRFLTPPERYRLVERYGLPSVPCLGRFSAERLDPLVPLLLDLNDRQREGIVLKSQFVRQAIKFVTPSSDLRDIQDSLIIDFDLHPRYFKNRLLRAVMFVQEFDLDRDTYTRLIGQAFLQGYAFLERFDESKEPFIIYVRRQETWEATLAMISQRVPVRVEEISPARLEDMDMLRIRFRRVYKRSTQRYRNILSGLASED